MNKLLVILAAISFFFVECARENPPPAKQEVLPQQEETKTGAMLLEDAKLKLSEAKEKLTTEGKLTCCLKVPCNMCVLEESECDCYKDLKKGEHVCVECYAGWQQGKGGIEGIKKEDVTTKFAKHQH